MGLSTELISEFVKITNDNKRGKEDSTIYATVKTVSEDGKTGTVQIDGSDELTPITSACSIKGADLSDPEHPYPGDRVRLNIRNHNAIVTDNLSDPSVGVQRASGIEATIKNLGDRLEFQVSDKEGSLASRITLLSNRIDSEVLDETTGLASKVTQQAGQIATLLKGPEGYSQLKQTWDALTFITENGTVKLSGGNIKLTGSISFADLSDHSDVNARIAYAESARGVANSAQATAQRISTDFQNVTLKENLWYDEEGNLRYTTYIDGGSIYADSIYANSLHLGGSLTVYDGLTSTTPGGYLGYDDGFNSTYGIGIRDATQNNQVVCTNQAARMSSGNMVRTPDNWLDERAFAQFVANYDVAYIDVTGSIKFKINGSEYIGIANHSSYISLRPLVTTTQVNLGNTSYRWGAVYATNGTIQTSDRNYKHDIETLPEKYIALFDGLVPRRFKMNEGTSGRYHTGYIAQEVEEAMLNAGIDSVEFGGFVRGEDEDGREICMLRYGEFDAVRDLKIKQLEARLATIEERIKS